MSFQWDEKYSTGNTTIDDQHKLLFTYLDELEEHIIKGASQEWVEQFMTALGIYTRSHFCFEEMCMRRAKCDAAAQNKVQHTKILAAFAASQKKFQQEGISDELLQQLKAFLTSWLINHIMKIDIRIKDCA